MIIGAFDIGGTNIKYGVLNEEGDILFQSKTQTNAFAGGRAIIDDVKRLLKKMLMDFELDGIGISTAGQINPEKGIVIDATDTIPGYIGINIKEELESTFGLPVTVDNDVNCAAIGEYWKGCAQSNDQFLCMTLGTGIGGAIVIDGQIYYGSNYSAGEIGHMTLYPNGKPCLCGDQGCYEQYASSRALQERAFEALNEHQSLPQLFERAQQGDEASERVIDQWVDDVALGMKSLVHIFNPSLIVIGGGISEQGDYLLNKLEKAVGSHIMKMFKQSLEIKFATHGNNANLLGAVYQIKSLLQENHY